MSISIIIPNYNGEKLLAKNLPKVLQAASFYKNEKIEIIVVDDASTDASVAYLKTQKVSLRVIEQERNLGFASTVNKGVKEAIGEIVVLLNTDVAPEKDFLVPLLAHFTDDKVFAVACMDKSIEEDKVVFRGRGVGKWQRGFLMHRAGKLDSNNTLWASGGSSAFRKSLWNRLGGFCELYNPFYWEDIDLSYRALKSGYDILFEKRSVVVHEHEKGAIQAKYSQEVIKQIAYRNQFLFVWRNATDLDVKFSHILWLPYHFASAALRGDGAFFRGFFNALILLPKIAQSNVLIRSDFVKKDVEVIADIGIK